MTIEDRRPLSGRRVVVTGAGTGIGASTAREAAGRGAALLLVGRRAARLDEVAEDCRAAGAGAPVDVLAVDLTEDAAPAKVVRAALDRLGGIDGLVNNAGLARFGPLDRSADDDVRAMFEINLMAPFRLIREAAAALRQGGGSVVNVSSIGGQVALPGRAAYGAIKAATTHLTRSLARELAPDIRVNTVAPGAVDTPMYDDLGLDDAGVTALRAQMVATTPAGRMGRADEVSPWICELLAPSSAWVTGAVFTIDGGRSC